MEIERQAANSDIHDKRQRQKQVEILMVMLLMPPPLDKRLSDYMRDRTRASHSKADENILHTYAQLSL